MLVKLEKKESQSLRMICCVSVVHGPLPFQMVCRPVFNYAHDVHTLRVSCQSALFRSESQSQALGSSIPLEEDGLGGAQACFTLEEQAQTSTLPNCTYSGKLIPIDLKRFTGSGINLVGCPHCGRMRSLSPAKGILLFKPHTRRKQQMLLTEKRWSATGKTYWNVIGG